MTNLTSNINVNVDTKIKNESEIILKDLGLDMNTFINMALIQVVKRNGIPFEVDIKTPSKELLDALQEGDQILQDMKNGKRKGYSNIQDLLKSLDED